MIITNLSLFRRYVKLSHLFERKAKAVIEVSHLFERNGKFNTIPLSCKVEQLSPIPLGIISFGVRLNVPSLFEKI